MMDVQVEGIITLIKSAITGEKLPLPDGFSLEKAMDQVGRHSLYGLCYQGAFLCGIPRNDKTMGVLFHHYCMALMHSEGQMLTLKKVFQAFEAHGIDYMPLKGAILKPLYPKPEMRPMGDADVLIRMEQYERIIPIMEALDFHFAEETDHELPWKSKTLYVELHKRLIPSYNQDYHAYYGNGWQMAKHRDGCCYAMADEDAFVYIFSHYAKHYRDGGIGCRHVTDLWVWRRAHPHMDEDYILEELKKLRLKTFYENTLHLLDVWFANAEPNPVTEWMTDYIFLSGNFGIAENHALSGGVKTMTNASSKKREWLKQLWCSLFPGREIMQMQYPVLKKYPWLMPLLWPVRLVRKLLFDRSAVEIRKRHLRALAVGDLEAFRESLQYVGLEFHF